MVQLGGEENNAAPALQPRVMHSTGTTWDGTACQKERMESLSVQDSRSARSLTALETTISSPCQNPGFSYLSANGLDNLFMVSNPRFLK